MSFRHIFLKEWLLQAFQFDQSCSSIIFSPAYFMLKRLFILMLILLLFLIIGTSGSTFETINFRNSNNTLVINTFKRTLTYNSKGERSVNYNYERIYFISVHIFITIDSISRCDFIQQKNGFYKSDLYISGKHIVEKNLKRY